MARTKFRLELNSAGVLALLNDPGVAADLHRRGSAMAAAMTGEWTVTSTSTHDRAVTFVRTADNEARRAVAEDPGSAAGGLMAGRG